MAHGMVNTDTRLLFTRSLHFPGTPLGINLDTRKIDRQAHFPSGMQLAEDL
jgi:hypothetical protein